MIKKYKGLAPATTQGLGHKDNTSMQNDNTICPLCKQSIQHEIPVHILFPDWLTEPELLANKYSYLGVTADIANISLIQLWGLYLYLKGLGG